MYDIDNILANSGFGESVSLGKDSGRYSKNDIEPDHQAYAECYAYALRDEVMMENEKLVMHIEVAKMRATGEDLNDLSRKVKEGVSNIKKSLIKLYEKAIRFFTETVRYFFSNEKRIGKVLAEIKAARKRVVKDSKENIDIVDFNNLIRITENWSGKKLTKGESFSGYGEKGRPAKLKNPEEEVDLAYARGVARGTDEFKNKFDSDDIEKLKNTSRTFSSVTGPAKNKSEYTTRDLKRYEDSVVAQQIVGKVNQKIKTLEKALAEKISNESSDLVEDLDTSTAPAELQTEANNEINEAKNVQKSLKTEFTGPLGNFGKLLIIITAIKYSHNMDKAEAVFERIEMNLSDFYDDLDAYFKDMAEAFTEKTSVSYAVAYQELDSLLESFAKILEDSRGSNSVRVAMNKNIKKLEEYKKKLEKDLKENKDESKGDYFQKARKLLIRSIKMSNFVKKREDRNIGLRLKLVSLILNEHRKVSK